MKGLFAASLSLAFLFTFPAWSADVSVTGDDPGAAMSGAAVIDQITNEAQAWSDEGTMNSQSLDAQYDSRNRWAWRCHWHDGHGGGWYYGVNADRVKAMHTGHDNCYRWSRWPNQCRFDRCDHMHW
jgi:hypothetical protein